MTSFCNDKHDVLVPTDRLKNALDWCSRLAATYPQVLPMSSKCVSCGVDLPGAQRRYCKLSCYFEHRKNPDHVYSRWGMMKARKIVSAYIELLPGHIVHHEDTDCNNNMLDNLRVFASQSDHLKHHHGLDVQPIWSGKDAA